MYQNFSTKNKRMSDFCEKNKDLQKKKREKLGIRNEELGIRNEELGIRNWGWVIVGMERRECV